MKRVVFVEVITESMITMTTGLNQVLREKHVNMGAMV